ncbi:MAG TPA: AAA family ATPase [Deltaproteobacteria bacterium]|nr:AAA family ATPase [Deltaproteobacteria bacterium]
MFDDVIVCPCCSGQCDRSDRFCRNCGESLCQRIQIQEYRHITALFSDLCDYTPLTEELEPEKLKDIMDTLFRKASLIISSYKGVVEKFAGDGVIALFGVDEMHEYDSIRAILAAKEIHRFASELADKVSATLGRRIAMHTGINSGMVLVDQLCGSPLSSGVLGTPINIASRLSDLAGPDDILIGDTVWADARRYFTIEHLGKKHIKGLKDPMDVLRVLSPRERPLCLHREVGLVSSMIGREEQFGIVMSAIDRLRYNCGCAVWISGDPGVGKSRLIEEARKHAASQVRWIQAQCFDHAKDTPYFPIALLVKELLDTGRSVSICHDLEDRITDLSCDPSFIPEIGFLCGLSPVNNNRNTYTPDEHRSRLSDAVSALFSSAGSEQCLVFCIEDIHWADPSTLDLLEYLFQDTDILLKSLFILSSRQGSFSCVHDIHIHLKDLTREETGSMIRRMLDGRTVYETVLDYLFRETGGNPFYIEEIVNYFMERDRALVHCSGHHVSAGVPSSVHKVISARIENLGKKLKTVLQEASVIGKVFSEKLLGAVSAQGDHVAGHLRDLVKTGFVKREDQGVYAFRHALTREVAYRSILKRNREKMHDNTGCALERMYDNKEDICDILAYHFDLAQDSQKAARYAMMAARKFHAEGSWVEAVSMYLSAEKWLKVSIAGSVDTEDLVAVWEGIWSCARIFSPDKALRALESLRLYYRKTLMNAQEAFVLVRMINLYSQKGMFAEALKTYDHALDLAGGENILSSAARTAVAYTYTYLGKPETALAFLDQARHSLKPDPFLLAVNHLTTLTAYVWKGSIRDIHLWYKKTKQSGSTYRDLDLMADINLAYSCLLEGNFAMARILFDQALKQERKLGNLAGGMSYLRIQSSIYFNARYIGDLDAAKEDLMMFERLGTDMKGSSGLIDLYHAWILIEEKGYETAKELLVRSCRFFEKGLANRLPYALNALAETLDNLGEYQEAAKEALRCIAWNEQNGNQDQLIWALRIMGTICTHQERYAEAMDYLKKSSYLSGICLLHPHTAWNMEAWGDYFHRTGKAGISQRCYCRAAALWSGMGNEYQVNKLSLKMPLQARGGLPGYDDAVKA